MHGQPAVWPHVLSPGGTPGKGTATACKGWPERTGRHENTERVWRNDPEQNITCLTFNIPFYNLRVNASSLYYSLTLPVCLDSKT